METVYKHKPGFRQYKIVPDFAHQLPFAVSVIQEIVGGEVETRIVYTTRHLAGDEQYTTGEKARQLGECLIEAAAVADSWCSEGTEAIERPGSEDLGAKVA